MKKNHNILIDWLLHLSRPRKRMLILIMDLVMLPLLLWSAFSIRLEQLYIPPSEQFWIFLLAPLIAAPIFIRMGLYRAIVRYIGFKALWSVVHSVLLYSLIWSLVILLAKVDGVPRSVFILNALFAMFFIGTSRMVARWIFNHQHFNLISDGLVARKNVIIYGAGSAGVQLASALVMGRELRPVAFIDDSAQLKHMQINGLKIFSLSDLAFIIEKYDAKEVLLAIPSASKKHRKKVIASLEIYPVHVRTIPGVSELAQGKIQENDIREIDIGDLLGREPVAPNNELLKANIFEKSVMVTGAGGSIGSELCRQIIKNKPTKLVLFEMSEFQLYDIEKELLHLKSGIELIPILGSVVDKKRVTEVCSAFGVQTIYHAAAYKHVPMVERNPGEGIRNNIMGTLNTAKAAIDTGVETFVLISTDKAVRPTNTMGATKRFAELVLQALSEDKSLCKNTRFTMVRFGNVLGSSGSVVPLFRDQIAKGGPVTVTDAKIIRYFMTIPEASELVIQAGAMGKGGDVFVLDMGSPVQIIDLAKRMVRLSGYEILNNETPDGDIEITITGLRPGEKLYEELLIGDNVLKTQHEKIMAAKEEVVPWEQLERKIHELERHCKLGDYSGVRDVLQSVVSGFVPQCQIVDEISLALIEAEPKALPNQVLH